MISKIASRVDKIVTWRALLINNRGFAITWTIVDKTKMEATSDTQSNLPDLSNIGNWQIQSLMRLFDTDGKLENDRGSPS